MKIHMVKQGDTLYSIAQKYHVDLDKLIEINPQITNPDQIDVGMKVKIPSSPVSVYEPPAGSYAHKHVVKQGDTLWKLAQQHGIPLQAMIDANPQLKNPNVLLTGEIVYIPHPGAVEAAGENPNMGVMAEMEPMPHGKKYTGPAEEVPGKKYTGPVENVLPEAVEKEMPAVELPKMEMEMKVEVHKETLPLTTEKEKAGEIMEEKKEEAKAELKEIAPVEKAEVSPVLPIMTEAPKEQSLYTAPSLELPSFTAPAAGKKEAEDLFAPFHIPAVKAGEYPAPEWTMPMEVMPSHTMPAETAPWDSSVQPLQTFPAVQPYSYPADAYPQFPAMTGPGYENPPAAPAYASPAFEAPAPSYVGPAHEAPAPAYASPAYGVPAKAGDCGCGCGGGQAYPAYAAPAMQMPAPYMPMYPQMGMPAAPMPMHPAGVLPAMEQPWPVICEPVYPICDPCAGWIPFGAAPFGSFPAMGYPADGTPGAVMPAMQEPMGPAPFGMYPHLAAPLPYAPGFGEITENSVPDGERPAEEEAGDEVVTLRNGEDDPADSQAAPRKAARKKGSSKARLHQAGGKKKASASGAGINRPWINV